MRKNLFIEKDSIMKYGLLPFLCLKFNSTVKRVLRQRILDIIHIIKWLCAQTVSEGPTDGQGLRSMHGGALFRYFRVQGVVSSAC